MIHHALIHGDIRISGHTEQALLLNGAGCKNGGGVMSHQLFDESETGRLAVLDKENAFKTAADRNDAEADPIPFVVQLCDIVDLFIAQERERMAGVHDLRAQQRQKFPLEIGFPEMLLLFAQVIEIHFFVSGIRQQADKMLKILVTLGLQFRHPGRDSCNLFGGGHVGDDIGLVVFQQRLVIQGPYANHEKLIHVTAENSSKLEPFTQRQIFFFGQCQHAAVKVQPTQFAIDKNAFRLFQNPVPPVNVYLHRHVRQSRSLPDRSRTQPCAMISPLHYPALPEM